MKNICHVTSVHNPNDNRIFYKECLSLKELGYNVTLIAPGSNDTSGKIPIIGIKKHKSRLLRMSLTSFFGVIKKCLKHKFDVYHFHDPEILPAAFVLSLLGKKLVFDCHENTKAVILGRSYIPNIIRKPLSKTVNFIESLVSKRLAGIVVARPDIAENFNHKNLVVLRNFPKLEDLKHRDEVNVEKSKLTFIYVGAMTRIRGIVELVKAFEGHDDCELWLLGPFTESGLKEECESLPGWENVNYIGKVKPFEVFSYIDKADIGICTFKEAPNHMRTLATKPFEYMSCSKPMILSDFPYWRNFFKDSAYYVNPASVEDISTLLSKLSDLKNSNEFVQVGNKNKELIYNEYNWEKESLRLKDLYQTIGQ